MKIRYLIPQNQLKSDTELLDLSVERCSANYRTSDERTLLFLLPGVNFDTYELKDEYIKSPHAAIVTENASKFQKAHSDIIEVKNARLSFAFASSRICEINYDNLAVIGVTGTNGKTTSATMIHRILTDAGIKCGFIGTGKMFFENVDYAEKYYSMTSPDPNVLYPVLSDMQKRGCTTVVLEASSHALALDKLSPIPFKIGIFTGISHEHLEFHKTMENYFLAKSRLIENSELGIINQDDEWGKKLYEKFKHKSLGISVNEKADVYAKDVKHRREGGNEYLLKYKDILTKAEICFPGIYNVYNSLFAFVAAYHMNISVRDINASLKNISYIDGRFEVIKDSVTVVIDYAHKPLALESILKTVKEELKPRQNITLVFGCGGERDPSKRPLMASVAEKLADNIIVSNDNPRGENESNIISDIEKGFLTHKHAVILDRALAIRHAIKTASDGDVVVIAGKGHEKYIKDKNGFHEFDEKSIVLNSLKIRKKG